MYKEDLALNNLQWLICHKTPTKPNHIYLLFMYKEDLALNNLQWILYIPKSPEPELEHQMQFSVILRTSLFWRKLLNPISVF